MGADIHAKHAREAAQKAIREADRVEAAARSVRTEGYGGPAQPSPTIARCHSPVAGYTDLEIGGFAQMPILPERSYSSAGANDQADRGAGDHALQGVHPNEER